MTKPRTGYLFKKEGRPGFYLRWKTNGKVTVKALADAEGNPITDRRRAEQKQLEIMGRLSEGQSPVVEVAILNAETAASEFKKDPRLVRLAAALQTITQALHQLATT
jgi:hypothetical protein